MRGRWTYRDFRAYVDTTGLATFGVCSVPETDDGLRFDCGPRQPTESVRNTHRMEAMNVPRIEPSMLEVHNERHELAALLALYQARVVPPHRLSAYVDQYGSAVKLVQLSEEDRLMSIAEGAHEVIGAVTPADIGRAISLVHEWEEADYRVVTVLDKRYPKNLREVFNCPPFLFIEGTWREDVDSRSIAVVGTRSCSDAGLKTARQFSKEFVEAEFTVLSGMASGIDTAAHTAALEAGGRTAAVMGTGLKHRYPKENADLADWIIGSGGALLTQFPPSQGPRPWTFPKRNIVMSGLSLATVVIEASETSGAKMQARVALQHGRTVFLLKNLVENHDWARDYVSEGRYGTEAIPIESTEEVVKRIEQPVSRDAVLAV